MKPIAWQAEYSIGIKELDEQHQNLLQIINTLIKEQQNPIDKKKFADHIAALIHYAYMHFAAEETLLIKVEFPDLQRHVIEHVDFIMKALSLSLKVGENNTENRQELLQYLQTWYATHVLGMDRLYITALAAAGFK